MLIGYPTKRGTGISVYGDYADLHSLYETVHDIADSLDERNLTLKAQHQLLMNFAYEIRKAYSGNRLQEKFEFAGDGKKLPYYGFQCVWPDILIFISTLRHNAGYVRTDKRQQANLYILEDVVERALKKYDPQGAADIKDFIGQRIAVTNQYAFIIYQALHLRFVKERSGKQRFRKIPSLILDYFSEWSPAYKELIHSFEVSSREMNCKVTDLEFEEFPEIAW